MLGRRMLPLVVLLLSGCGDDAVSSSAGGGGDGGAGDSGSTTDMPAASTSSSESMTGGPVATTSGSSSVSTDGGEDDSSSSSTGAPLACPDGVEVVGIDGLCVTEPIVIDASPAYDVLAYGGIVVSNDAGVTQYRSVDGGLVEVSTVALPGRGHDLLPAYFEPEPGMDDERPPERSTRLLVTVPDANRLAVIDSDATDALDAATLLETGARPVGVTFVASPFASGVYYATANADDGTLSLFSPQPGETLALATTVEVGGQPRDIASVVEYIGVIDTVTSTLSVLTVDEDGVQPSGTYEVPEGPVSLLGLRASDNGPSVFLVVSRDAAELTLVRAEDGLVMQQASLSGGPSQAVITRANWLPERFRDSELWFWVGAVPLTDASSIAIGMHGGGRGAPVIDRFVGDIPTAEAPVAVVLSDVDGDGNGDFVTASPAGGLTAVLQQPSRSR